MRRNGFFGFVVPVLAIAAGIVLTACGGGAGAKGAGNGGGGNPGGGSPGAPVSIRVQIPESIEGMVLALDDPNGTHVVSRVLHDNDNDGVVQLTLPDLPAFVTTCMLRPSITRADRSVVWAWVNGGHYPNGAARFFYHDANSGGPFWFVAENVGGKPTAVDSVAQMGIIQAVVFQ